MTEVALGGFLAECPLLAALLLRIFRGFYMREFNHESLHSKEMATEAKTKVLLADSCPSSRELLASTLRSWDYDVVAVEDEKQALQQLEAKDGPKLAIIDGAISQLNGRDFCKKLRERTSRTPVYILLLTTKDDKNDVVEGLQAGANDYVTRPFDAAELRARLAVGEQAVLLQHMLDSRIRDLEAVVNHVKHLHGVLPICCICKRIRDDEGAWNELEAYITAHSDAGFSHGICPECRTEHYCECISQKDKAI